MITYYLKKWWYHNGWTYLLIGSIVAIFFLWMFYANRNQASSTTSFQNALEMMFSSSSPSPVARNDFQTHRESDYFPQYNNLKQNETSQGGTSIGEEECRRIMEDLTGKPFRKERPDFLKNPITGQCLELDLYNSDLKLAVEYNGKQHYEYNEYMHQGSRDKFRNQQYRDYIKNQLCRENGIYLITVPYNIKRSEIKSFLMKEVRKYLNK